MAVHRATVIGIVCIFLCGSVATAEQDGVFDVDENSLVEGSGVTRTENDRCDDCTGKVEALAIQFEALSLRIDVLSSILTASIGDIFRILDRQEQATEGQPTTATTPSTITDCRDVRKSGRRTSGLYNVTVGDPKRDRKIEVYCDFDTPGGDWLVFQRRQDGSVKFERTWNEYANGFGDPSGEFWIGNEILHLLTSQRKYELRIDMEDFQGQKRYAKYSVFRIASEAEFFRLTVGGYSGNAGDSLIITHNGRNFTTFDSDNDVAEPDNCAKRYRGAWWYSACHYANLNGLYLGGPHRSNADGIEWATWHGWNYSLKKTEMKIAPVK